MYDNNLDSISLQLHFKKSSIKQYAKWLVMVHIYNSSSWQVEAEGSLKAILTNLGGQPELIKPCLKNKTKIFKEWIFKIILKVMPCETALCLHLLHNSQKQENCALFFASAMNRKTTTSNIHLLNTQDLPTHCSAYPSHSMGPPPVSLISLSLTSCHTKKKHKTERVSYKTLQKEGEGVYISHTWIYPGYLNQYEVHWWRELNLQAAVLLFPWNTENTHEEQWEYVQQSLLFPSYITHTDPDILGPGQNSLPYSSLDSSGHPL